MSDKIREYQRKYYQEHKEELNRKRREYRLRNKDKLREKRKEYYVKNKEMILESTKRYIQKNRKKVTKLVNKRRKEVALELKEKGQIYTYLNKSARENKMVEKLSKIANINENEAREMLIENDWNYKSIVERFTF